MNLTIDDITFLETYFPDLSYDPQTSRISGELSFHASYDQAAGKVSIERLEASKEIRTSENFLSDAYEIEIRLAEIDKDNAWPTVYEVIDRRSAIAEWAGVKIKDLHFSDDGACCLGIRYSRERYLTLERFLYELVIPFFYRLSYINRFGIAAARSRLWGEYSHGNKGHREHQQRMLGYSQLQPRRRAPCPCGSGRIYKSCCLDEVQAVSTQSPLLPVDPRPSLPYHPPNGEPAAPATSPSHTI